MRKISSQTAADKANVTSATIVNWCKHPRFSVGGKSIGEISLGEWRVDPSKLALIIKGERFELIKELFEEKVSDMLFVRDEVLVYFEEMSNIFYLNMFRDELRYYGRRRNMELSVEVPFLAYTYDDKTERIPVPLSKIMLMEVLIKMRFEKRQDFYLLRR